MKWGCNSGFPNNHDDDYGDGNFDDDNIEVGVRHILDVEEQDWLLREDVAKGCYHLIIAIPNSLSSAQNTKYFVSKTKYAEC